MFPLSFGFEKQPLIGLYLGHHMSQSTDKLAEWFWQQGPLFFYLCSITVVTAAFIMTVDITHHFLYSKI